MSKSSITYVFVHDVHMRITSKFPGSLKTHGLSTATDFSCVKTHFRTLILVDSMKLSFENSRR